MKKLLGFVGALCLFMGTAHAACVVTSCGGRGDDCINAYSLEVKPEGRVAKNEVYICGKNHCQNGTIIHDYALDKFYMCVIASDAGVNFMWMGNDTWEEYPVSTCSEPSDGYILNADPNATKALRNSTDRTETLRKNDTGSVVLQAGSNICIEYKCNPGYVPNESKTACVVASGDAPEEGDTGNDTDNGASDNGQNNDDQNGGGESVTPGATQSCVQRRCGGLTGNTYSQCITCCYVPASVAVWNSGTRMCECVDKSKKFNPSTLQCEVQNVVQPQPTQPEEDYECDEHQIEVLQQLSVQYANNAEVIAQINQIFTYCAGDPVRAVFNNMFNQVNVLIDQQTLAASQSASRSRIESAAATLENIRSGLRLTVWRNDEGKFNTSRLLSDSIAGVVLGTAGGLITSNVVKKNQVEDGFEDLQCTVGGQVVAGWGDEFRVGIQ